MHAFTCSAVDNVSQGEELHQFVADIHDVRQTKLRRIIEDLPTLLSSTDPFIALTNVTLIELHPVRAFLTDSMTHIMRITAQQPSS
jgi:hypothetical protein